jgi:hypothetical protein
MKLNCYRVQSMKTTKQNKNFFLLFYFYIIYCLFLASSIIFCTILFYIVECMILVLQQINYINFHHNKVNAIN